jgi:formylglycine-generating enzyme required for sulfatase activity
MGSPPDEEDRLDDEALHEVSLAEPYYCGKFPVIQAQWQAVMGSDPSESGPVCKDAPVENVNWEDCQAFLRRLCEIEGTPQGTYRLLTEAEWEYACRAGTTTRFYTGNREEDLGRAGWYRANAGWRCAVGGKKPNGYGLYDMHGSVWEWVEDDWHDSYEGAPRDGRAWVDVPQRGASRVNRGGGWGYDAGYCRSAFRDWNAPSNRLDFLGFRLSRSLS